MKVLDYRRKEFSRVLRKEQTQSEEIVWALLRNRKFHNLKFRRQHLIKGYVVDFYCSKLQLAIEIDGKIHDKQKDYDQIRQTEIESKGITVIRITNTEIKNQPKVVFEKIKSHIQMNYAPLARVLFTC